MSIMKHLITFGLHQVIGDTADQGISAFQTHFTDHSKTLPRALARANDRAW